MWKKIQTVQFEEIKNTTDNDYSERDKETRRSRQGLIYIAMMGKLSSGSDHTQLSFQIVKEKV